MIGCAPRRIVRRPDAHRLLLRDLLARLPDAALTASRAEPWASATFAGTRHVVALNLCSPSAAKAFADGAAGLEFELRGHVVADLAAVAEPGGRLTIEALTVEDA